MPIAFSGYPGGARVESETRCRSTQCLTSELLTPKKRPELGFFESGVRTLNCPLFLNRQMEIMRFWLLTFPRLGVLDTSPAHPWKPQLAWLFLYRGADPKLYAFRIRGDRTR
jgi:hypothetical protein